MGDPRKLKPKMETPRKVWDVERIKEDRKLIGEYGLRNVGEVWRASLTLKKKRREVRRLLARAPGRRSGGNPHGRLADAHDA